MSNSHEPAGEQGQPPAPKRSTRATGVESPATTDEPSPRELSRFKAFIGIQFVFLLASPLAGGFHYKLWSMMDTALLTLSIGISALTFVLETPRARRMVFRAAAFLYILGVFDMAINVLLSGIVGWRGGVGPP